MKDGSMFHSLHNYEDKAFFDENKYINIYTPDGELKYRIFAAIHYDDRLILGYYSDFEDKKDFEDCIADIYTHEGNVDESVDAAFSSDIEYYKASEPPL